MFLSPRPQPQKQLRDALRIRGFTPEQIEVLLAYRALYRAASLNTMPRPTATWFLGAGSIRMARSAARDRTAERHVIFSALDSAALVLYDGP